MSEGSSESQIFAENGCFFKNYMQISDSQTKYGLLPDAYSANRERIFRRSTLSSCSCSLLKEPSFWA